MSTRSFQTDAAAALKALKQPVLLRNTGGGLKSYTAGKAAVQCGDELAFEALVLCPNPVDRLRQHLLEVRVGEAAVPDDGAEDPRVLLGSGPSQRAAFRR